MKEKTSKLDNINFKNVIKGEKGITLIALIITIIVIMILLYVAINVNLGNNGVITQAQRGKEQTTISWEKEQIEMAYKAAEMEKIKKGIQVQ